MSTVIPEKVTQTEETSSDSMAPKTILKSTYAAVMSALHEKSNKLILITGESNKGKTSLLHTIIKDIATKNRIITLSGKDLPALDTDKNNTINELNTMKDFILESTDLEDNIVVILDDAHCLPINFITGLIEGIKTTRQESNNLQLIFSGPLNFKDQLLAVENINAEELLHCTIDNFNNEEINAYIKNKVYNISSDIKRIHFDDDSLSAIADFIQSDQQLLDVILEWCAAIIKKDQLNSVSSQIVNRAGSFARQFSKDKNVHLSNAYPPSHEVYKYINDIQSTKKAAKNNATNVSKNSVKKTHTSKTAPKKPKIPTISENIEPNLADKQNEKLIDADKLGEVMQTKWVPSSKPIRTNKKSFAATATFTTALIIAFITFIVIQITSEPQVEDQSKPLVTKNKLNETIADNQAVNDQTTASVLAAVNRNEVVITNPAVKKNAPDLSVSTKIPAEPKHSDNSKDTDPEPPKRALSVESELIKQPEEKAEAAEQLLESEISELLVLAKYQFENKHLSTPTGDNALETYQKILAKHPNNQEAIQGIKNVHDKYLSWANYYLQLNELDRAKNFYNKALGIDPSNTSAITNLQAIAQKEAAVKTAIKNEAAVNNLNSQQIQPREIESLLAKASEKMQQINSDISENNRNYKNYQEVQTTYQEILKSSPQNQQALKGLVEIKSYYADWAELQVQSQNYNIALFLYGQALSIDPENVQINQRIEQIRDLKKTR